MEHPSPVGASPWQISTLGAARLDSPLAPLIEARERSENYVDESDLVLVDDVLSTASERGVPVEQLPGLEPGGPRRKIFFDPSKLRVGIVTCGGLCPGLNNVVRGLVLELWHQYGVRRVHGFRNGYEGFVASYGHEVVDLTPESVRGIDEQGGTVLGTSRGQQDPEDVVDCLERLGIGVLFVVGGDGSMRGALGIAGVVAQRGLKISVVGVPKTIDNDIPFIDHSFGFQTAFARAAETIRSVVVEARSTPHGVGLVKLMGRHSGFIASYAALARNDADYVLVPEVPFGLEDDDGREGLLSLVQRRVAERGNAVVVVAEGAGQDLVPGDGVDASGNAVLGDVGRYLRRRLLDSFAAAGRPVNLRYVDPSYAIRSVPANGYDAVYCLRLAHAAVHAAMAGRTAMVVGRWHGRFVHVPIELAISRRNVVDPHGDLWLSVLEATGQPTRVG
ncbi:ATP-dependent 6-phosphofructokinase [Streptomyces sp. NP160]|uniref:ATP-dependent 6-phosphofructokinase n=1 Tax=Streptomyces sp. NP160 TaxID=2586637 RepID=UPI0011194BF9|nr:ATP-dependent 6-phosphofructokinase [Streptomyces sp. NP160]TNM67676.1 ATP-dependent 6-phosphofructokinase [Streptomyces sp. NP160]